VRGKRDGDSAARAAGVSCYCVENSWVCHVS
jgi:hypothetical protein